MGNIDVSNNKMSNKNNINYNDAMIMTYLEKLRDASINKKYFIKTFGCQLNENDSEKIAGMLEEMGYEESNEMNHANIIVFNTCTIRENANDKIFGNLGIANKLKQTDPTRIVVLCGCMMKEKENAEKVMSKYRFVDIIFGPSDLHKLPEMLYKKIQSLKKVYDIGDEDLISEGLPVKHKKKFRALCTIIYGCNNFCTYCIVPYVRGRERSRKMEHVLDELISLGEQGYKEVMFLGQNVNSYGKDLDDGDFADLLDKAGEIKSIKRIRFMTSHPKDISRKLIDVMAKHPSIMPHLHLPLQSGSDKILSKMNRGYTTSQYYDIIEYARTLIPEITISTDIIVGFPGESDEDFQDTLAFMEKVSFDSAFTFQYSKRTGTPAASYEDQVSESVVKARFEKLIALQNRCNLISYQKTLNTVQEVLIEGSSEQRDDILTGRTPHNRLVNFSYDINRIPKKYRNEANDFEGLIAKVKITKAMAFSLEGELQEIME